jgi:hypothetical protein
MTDYKNPICSRIQMTVQCRYIFLKLVRGRCATETVIPLLCKRIMTCSQLEASTPMNNHDLNRMFHYECSLINPL